uniref:Terminase n=1 Tax=OCS116 cluster bacterium TaxID=2030921 RepID=A0A2A4YV36_9PROT
MKNTNLSPKQERFALRYLESGNATKAYKHAYNVSANSNVHTLHREGCKLLNHPKIAPRIAELQKVAQAETMVTLEKLTKELNDTIELAQKQKQPAVMVRAIMAKAKLHGLIGRKSAIHKNICVTINSQSD